MFSNREKLFIFALTISLLIAVFLNIVKNAQVKNNINKVESITTYIDKQFDSISARILNIPDSELKQLINPEYDINLITRDELESIPGIGPVLAKRIIDYRNKTGKISNLEELVNIKGIGKKKLVKIQKFLYVKK
ncbi:hypothetical protein DRQ09_07670 [candidate division KSB1 bacterium]|nr:MAG: hypothetical protein DRQ09_07670 [candidate division KSB1 bacterium]